MESNGMEHFQSKCPETWWDCDKEDMNKCLCQQNDQVKTNGEGKCLVNLLKSY